ncbi:MAG: ferredoxin family protein [Planctomycetota bacterium]
MNAISDAPLTVVLSRGQSRNPQKRGLEQAIANSVAQRLQLPVLSVPHLYDLQSGGDSLQRLQQLDGEIVVLTWIYPRAATWVLDRVGVRGTVGDVQLDGSEPDFADEDVDDNPLNAVGEDTEDASDEDASDGDAIDRVARMFPRPDRRIYTIDLRVSEKAEDFLGEIARIAGAPGTAAPIAPQADDEKESTISTTITGESPTQELDLQTLMELQRVDESTTRRWYPVIDYDRCTNCMECIDFCLFGVYGVDGAETILVEQPDSCRKGCPACSRVCPENAIIFPQHKAPAIAGSPDEDAAGLKIDLSLLFGAPKDDDPIATAARERDEQLLLAGRDAIGIDGQLKRRQTANATNRPKDDLDRLIDELDALDL